MNIWEAKYRALCQGIGDSKYIDNAEKLVEQAIKLSNQCNFSLGFIIEQMLAITSQQLIQQVEKDFLNGTGKHEPLGFLKDKK